ncbi:hypothetical protein Ddc_19622 [Ditylenchus destructor]|nr:hypothetical protein Ddc_19622 [Ditylenchus destructor]
MSGVKITVMIAAFLAISFCSAEFFGLQNAKIRISRVFQAEQNETCTNCHEVVKHARIPRGTTPEDAAQELKRECARPHKPPHFAEFCNAVKGKEQAFATAVIDNLEHPEKKIDPCKVVHLC